jgi:histidyl-tRNA synthetase
MLKLNKYMPSKIQALKGFRDFGPVEAKKRAWLQGQMTAVFESWGYEPIETPTLEPLELFEGQIGEDEKLFYKFTDNGGRNVALRYDQTVPTCRFVGNNYNSLTFPFKRYQIQNVFRAEKPQAGRYREFIHVDADIIGNKNPEADAEVIALMLSVYQALGLNAKALINNRKLIKNIPYEAISAIDKLKKIGEEGVIADMIKKGISKTLAESYLQQIAELTPDTDLEIIFSYLKSYGFSPKNFAFEPTLARSFSYSDGPIWEIIVPEYTHGSLGGGERYDGLIAKISGADLGGTGFGIGFDRTLEALEQLKLLPSFETTTKVLVTTFSPDLFEKSLEITRNLRQAGISSELYPDPSAKLEKQLKYADKKAIPFAIILGPDEVKNQTVTIKNLKSKTQETKSQTDLTNQLK